MINKIISWSIRHRLLVILATVGIAIYGAYSLSKTPIDAIPDLSDKQVIVYTEWMGRSPQLVENQVTFPLMSNLVGIPKVKDIRATSMFGMSFIYVIFNDDADIYWARTRVMEKLEYAQKYLPKGINPSLGPDASGVGQVFWYTLDAPGYSLGELRALQDWYIKFALQSVEGVSEVASFGGYQKQYQVKLDPNKLKFFHIKVSQIIQAINQNNKDVGGGSIDVNNTNYIIRGLGYLKSKEDLANITVQTQGNTPIRIKDLGTVEIGGEIRFGITDDNGNGEVVGGTVLMNYESNADDVIARVKEKIKEVEKGLPAGVSFKVAYDRSKLIEASVNSIEQTIWEEIILVCVIVLLFLYHFRSALVVIMMIPISILFSFIFFHWMGFTSNIMSLSGIAIAIGVVVDNGIVMVENAYNKLSK